MALGQGLFPLWISLKVALLALVIVLILGVGLAQLVGRRTFRGHELIDALLMLPMVLPPTVVGFALLLLLGRQGPLGRILESVFHQPALFTWWAGALAAAAVAFPLMYGSAKAGMESLDPNLEKAARTLGASKFKVFFTVTLPLAWPGILSGMVLSFTRALGEFGATLMVAGNIPGRTQTISMAIYSAAAIGDNTSAAWYVAFSVIAGLVSVWGLNLWASKGVRRFAGFRR